MKATHKLAPIWLMVTFTNGEVISKEQYVSSLYIKAFSFFKLIFKDSTPYENGHFVLDITLPPDYPYAPPEVCYYCAKGSTF
jgi:ubiquitin-protein ligase